jgi:F-type H+-transporting ATPase subunit epsilon
MIVSILSPEREIYKGKVKSVKVPGSAGTFEILQNHAAIVSSLKAGKISLVEEGGDKKQYEIASGFVEVIRNEISLLVSGVKEL